VYNSVTSFTRFPHVSFICVARLLTQVYETSQGNNCLVDTGHSRPIDKGFVHLPSSQSPHLSVQMTSIHCLPTTYTPSPSCFSEKRSTQGKLLSGSGRQSVDMGHLRSTKQCVCLEVVDSLWTCAFFAPPNNASVWKW